MTVPPHIWRQVFERDRGICQYCDADLLANFSVYWSATVDHVVAVAREGPHTAENLKLCCPGCNGMLSRSSSLSTFEERKAFIKARRRAEHEGYLQWCRELRGS